MRPPLVVIAALLALLAAAPPDARAVGACDAIERAAPADRGKGIRRAPFVVADSSMMVGVKPLARLGFEADARGCRSMGAAVDILAARRSAGTLPRLAVIVAGANGGVTQAQVDRALRIVGRRRMLGLVTSGGSASAAEAMRVAARRRPKRIVLIDWRASGGPARYGGDGIHIGVAGETELARMIDRRTRPYQPPPRSLKVPRTARGAQECGTVAAGQVFVVRGRAPCERAREVASTPVRRAIPGWRSYAWSIVGPPPWSAVYARVGGEAVIAVRRSR